MSHWGEDVVPTERVLKEVVDRKLKEISDERDSLRLEIVQLRQRSAKQVGDLEQEVSTLKAVSPNQFGSTRNA